MTISVPLHTFMGLDSGRLLAVGILFGLALLAPGAIVFADGLLRRRTRAAAGAALIAVGLTVGVCAFGASRTLHTADIHGLTQAGLTGVDWQPLGTEHRVTYTRDGRIRHGTIRLGDKAITLTETTD